jgi:hypothetical protein
MQAVCLVALDMMEMMGFKNCYMFFLVAKIGLKNDEVQDGLALTNALPQRCLVESIVHMFVEWGLQQ